MSPKLGSVKDPLPLLLGRVGAAFIECHLSLLIFFSIFYIEGMVTVVLQVLQTLETLRSIYLYHQYFLLF